MPFFLPGIRLPHRKNTADRASVRIPSVDSVTIPMLMHIGTPATPTVRVGDTVSVGTNIARACGTCSAPIHASVSGTVVAVSDISLASGETVPAVTIASDGRMTPDRSLHAPVIGSREDLLAAIKESGIVGLGGAGFPTHIKWSTAPADTEDLIINGAECEPYITSDTLTMTGRADDIALALRTLLTYFPLRRVIIGMEGNQNRAVRAMRTMAAQLENTEVKVLPQRYPQGAEKVLVYHTTAKTIPMGGLPGDAGCIVCNCTTIASIGAYLRTGMPLVEKCITVDGGAVAVPQNLTVPIGTPLSVVFFHCGGFCARPAKVLYGGPMMGVTVPDLRAPVLKNTNAVLALTPKETYKPKTTACIRCGACTNVCPIGLAPAEIQRAYRKRDTARLTALSADACMLCGCCSYVCPAGIPLVMTHARAKQLLRGTHAT